MVEVRKYQLPPTDLIPNSPQPLLHYPGLLAKQEDCSAPQVYDLFSKNGWKTQWIFRNGSTQRSHYHSIAQQSMADLTGSATIRFGVADTVTDMDENTHGDGMEAGGIELQARAGDVFILPAGTAHKTYDTKPEASFVLLTPGDGHHVAAGDIRKALDDVELSGVTMIGAYPIDGGEWDFAKGGESEGEYEKVWAVPKPENDPVLGKAEDGLCGLWQ